MIAMLLVQMMISHLLMPDWFPQLATFGLSFGTNYHYCFADLVHGHLTAGCESAS